MEIVKPITEYGKIRPISYSRDTNTRSDSCCTYKQGATCIIAGINAPPIIDVQVYEKCGTLQGQRISELEEFIKSGVEWTVLVEKYPRGLVNVCTQVVCDDGSLDGVAMNGVISSLLFGGVDMKGIVVGVCVSGRESDNTIDICVDAQNNGIVAMKLSGHCSDSQLSESLEISKRNAHKISKAIRTLVERQYTN
ncbi:Exoribonuclease phosphorolytic domain-containing protein [Entamoeba marina]